MCTQGTLADEPGRLTATDPLVTRPFATAPRPALIHLPLRRHHCSFVHWSSAHTVLQPAHPALRPADPLLLFPPCSDTTAPPSTALHPLAPPSGLLTLLLGLLILPSVLPALPYGH